MGQVETLVHCGEDCLWGKNTSDSKVVLTNMKVISNEKSEGLRQCPLTTSESPEKPGPPKPSTRLDLQTTPQIPGEMEHFATRSGTPALAVKCQVPRLARSEAEDSAAVLPQGPDLPSTHRGSEKNFVLHSRDSSCDSGVLSASSSPAADHIKMLKGKDPTNACHYASECKEPGELCTGPFDALQMSALSLADDTDGQEEKHPGDSFLGGREGEGSQDKANEEEAGPCFSMLPADEKRLGDRYGNSSLEELPVQGQPLRKYSTSDSLDEYMDACCRLSKVNEGNSKTYSSGLGFLEHICQLMEKIGQLQEQNLKLQKEICSLQKEQKTNQLKEEYLLQHCSCGAANFLLSSYQEARNSFPGWNSSRPHSLLAQNGIVSELSVIPETGGNKERSSKNRKVEL